MSVQLKLKEKIQPLEPLEPDGWVNLKRSSGHRYRISYDPAWKLEKTDRRDPEHFYYIIPAKYGEFYPDGDMVGFYCKSNRIKKRFLAEIPSAFIHQNGDKECSIIFPFEHFEKAAEIAQARKRRVLSDKQKKILMEKGAPYQFKKK